MWVIRPWQPDDVEGILHVHNQSAPMHRITLSEFHRDIETLEPDLQRMIFVAESDSKVVGVVIMSRMAGMFHPQKFMIELAVLESHRNQGIGPALYDTAENHLKDLNVISISTQVSEQNLDGLSFAESRGYSEQKRDFVSILDLADFDPSLFGEVNTELEIFSLADQDSPELRQEWYDLFSIVRQDVPRTGPPSPLAFDFFEEQIVNEPDLVRSATLFARKDGQMIGFTAGFHDQESNNLDQWLTAVDREYRRHHVALTLKVAQALEVKRLGIERIKTDNDTRNTPMLRVNEKLGFVRQPAVLSLQKDFWGCQG